MPGEAPLLLSFFVHSPHLLSSPLIFNPRILQSLKMGTSEKKKKNAKVSVERGLSTNYLFRYDLIPRLEKRTLWIESDSVIYNVEWWVKWVKKREKEEKGWGMTRLSSLGPGEIYHHRVSSRYYIQLPTILFSFW